MDFQTQKSGLVDLIGQLLSESFAIEQTFSQMNLQEIGELIEDKRDQFESPDALSDAFIQKMESFEKCKSTYCLILLELEFQNTTELPDQILCELLETLAPGPSIAINDEEDSMSEKTMIGLGISRSLPSHAEKLEEDFPILEPISPLLSHEPESTRSAYAQGFVDLAALLQEWQSSAMHNIQPSHFGRVIAQNLCWGLECELFTRIQTGLESLWEKRSEYITPLLVQTGRSIELIPELKTTIEEQASANPQWLFEARFPAQGMVTSLRYFMSVPDLAAFNPAPLDLAGLVLLFGHGADLGFQFHNRLGLKGLAQEEVLELAFRLTRIQRLKAKVLSPHHEWDESHFHTIEEDINACESLVLKLSCEDVKHLQEVA